MQVESLPVVAIPLDIPPMAFKSMESPVDRAETIQRGLPPDTPTTVIAVGNSEFMLTSWTQFAYFGSPGGGRRSVFLKILHQHQKSVQEKSVTQLVGFPFICTILQLQNYTVHVSSTIPTPVSEY